MGTEMMSCSIVSPMLQLIADDWLLAQDRVNTRSAYRRDLDWWLQWCSSNGVDPIEATARDGRKYRRHLEMPRPSGKPYQESTVHRRLTAVSSFYTFATRDERELVAVNPMANVKRPKLPRQSKADSLDLDELRRLFAVAASAGPWDAAFVKMLFYSSARISELCNASTSDLGVERGKRILWVDRKGGGRIKLVIARPGAEALNVHLAGRQGALFLGRKDERLKRGAASYRLKKLATAAGIKGKSITPHSMRHTYATLGRDAGVDIRDIQRAMGHSKLETTMRYEHSRVDVDNSPTHALARLLEGAPS